MPPFTSTTPLRAETEEHPTGAKQELLEISLKLLHPPFIVEGVRAGLTVTVDREGVASFRSSPSQFELLAIPREGPDLLFHRSLYRPVRAGRIVNGDENCAHRILPRSKKCQSVTS